MKRLRYTRPVVLSVTILASAAHASAANVLSTWNSATNANWNLAGSWVGSTIPSSSIDTELTFGGASIYTATNNIPSPPFVLNRLNVTNTSAASVTGTPLAFSTNTDGTGPVISVTTNANHNIFNSGITLNAPLTFTGSGTSTLSVTSPMTGGAVSVTHTGAYNITASVDNSAITGGLFVKRGIVQLTSTNGNFRGSNVTINNGGAVYLGSNSTISVVPDRLGDAKTVTLTGGELRLNGQAFTGAALNANASETIGTLALSKGYSTLFTSLGNAGSSGTTLNAALSRSAGTTAFAKGGSLGGAAPTQKILFTNAQSAFLKGGGGAAGTPTVSIYPFMVADGTNAFAGSSSNFATYDANGIRALNTTTEYTTLALGGATSNVVVGTNLSIPSDKTINALRITGGAGNINDGVNARILTIASGAVAFANDGNNIGTSTGPSGTLNFGTSEGIIFSIATHTNTVRSVLAGSAGLTKGGTGTLVLGGSNTYIGQTSINSGTLRIGEGNVGSGVTTTTGAKLGVGDVEVADGATLLIRQGILDGITDAALVTLRNDGFLFGRMNIETGISETVGALTLGSVAQVPGTYGSTSSSATYKIDTYFSGAGILNVVLIPEPTTVTLLGIAGLLVCGRRVRRSSR